MLFSSASEIRVTFCRLGRNVRLVLLLAWETLLPTSRPLPVSSQIRDISISSWNGSPRRPGKVARIAGRGRFVNRQLPPLCVSVRIPGLFAGLAVALRHGFEVIRLLLPDAADVDAGP